MSTQEKLISYLKKELKSQRSELNLSQEKMSELLGISLHSYSDLERGKNFCCIYTLINFTYKCNVDKDKLLTNLGKIMNDPED